MIACVIKDSFGCILYLTWPKISVYTRLFSSSTLSCSWDSCHSWGFSQAWEWCRRIFLVWSKNGVQFLSYDVLGGGLTPDSVWKTAPDALKDHQEGMEVCWVYKQRLSQRLWEDSFWCQGGWDLGRFLEAVSCIPAVPSYLLSSCLSNVSRKLPWSPFGVWGYVCFTFLWLLWGSFSCVFLSQLHWKQNKGWNLISVLKC